MDNAEPIGLPAEYTKPPVRRSSKWPRVRAVHLTHEPVCQACGGRQRLEVHHILPVNYAPWLELDSNNLITLCEGEAVNCHLLFGHLRNYQSYNPTVVYDAALWRRKIATRPMPYGWEG